MATPRVINATVVQSTTFDPGEFQVIASDGTAFPLTNFTGSWDVREVGQATVFQSHVPVVTDAANGKFRPIIDSAETALFTDLTKKYEADIKFELGLIVIRPLKLLLDVGEAIT